MAAKKNAAKKASKKVGKKASKKINKRAAKRPHAGDGLTLSIKRVGSKALFTVDGLKPGEMELNEQNALYTSRLCSSRTLVIGSDVEFSLTDGANVRLIDVGRPRRR